MTTPTIRKTLTATRREEIEALAQKLYVAFMAIELPPQCSDGQIPDDWDEAERSFNAAEAWLAERDRRREEEK